MNMLKNVSWYQKLFDFQLQSVCQTMFIYLQTKSAQMQLVKRTYYKVVIKDQSTQLEYFVATLKAMKY